MTNAPALKGSDRGALLEVSDLRVSFPTEHGELYAVRGLTYRVEPGEVVAMVGELHPDGSLEVTAVSDLGEECYATPAIADGRLYVRTVEHLYSFGLSE